MTAYSVFADSGNHYLGIRAVTFEIKITGITIHNGYTSVGTFYLYRKSNAALSGGSVVTPVPLREGAAASTAQCRVGALSFSSADTVAITTIPGIDGTTDSNPNHGGTGNFDIPADATILPGSMFILDLLTASSGSSLGQGIVHFEELRLSWHY